MNRLNKKTSPERSGALAAIARSHGLLRPRPPTGHEQWTGAVDYPASLPDVDEIWQ